MAGVWHGGSEPDTYTESEDLLRVGFGTSRRVAISLASTKSEIFHLHPQQSLDFTLSPADELVYHNEVAKQLWILTDARAALTFCIVPLFLDKKLATLLHKSNFHRETTHLNLCFLSSLNRKPKLNHWRQTVVWFVSLFFHHNTPVIVISIIKVDLYLYVRKKFYRFLAEQAGGWSDRVQWFTEIHRQFWQAAITQFILYFIWESGKGWSNKWSEGQMLLMTCIEKCTFVVEQSAYW